MSLTAVLLGVINVAIVVALLVIIGLIIEWFLGALGFPVPAQIRKVFMIIVALVALYLLVALLLGIPTIKIVGPFRATAAIAAVSAGPAADL